MASATALLLLLLIAVVLVIPASVLSQSIIQSPSSKHHRQSGFSDDGLFCDSWRFTVETNDAGNWSSIPSRCCEFVKDYMFGSRYLSDSAEVANYSLRFAQTVEIRGDGKDAWVFDIDETLLSNLPHYHCHKFGSETFDEVTFDEWVDLAELLPLPESLSLYKELEQLGFKIFLLTGRSECKRNATEKNLLFAGYNNWERLLMRGPFDKRKLARIYKSEKRSELINEGYRIHGSSGDQWSDLLGCAVAQRSFKLPNPWYYIA